MFLLVLIIPIVNFNLEEESVSLSERRKLANIPSFIVDGKYNKGFPTDFEKWMDDNIGFRSYFIVWDANIKFNLFGTLPKEGGYLLGPKKELNYYTDDTLKNYQRLNLATPGEIERMADGYEALEHFTKKWGIDYYYIQNWDKDTIYPEQYPRSVIQHSDTSRMEQKINELKKRGLTVISCKDELIEGKKYWETYPAWGDVTHYSDRGAFITYTKLMEAINKNNGNKYKVLTEKDYDITIEDKGGYVFGNIHMPDLLETFTIKNKRARASSEEPMFKKDYETPGNYIYINNYVNNNDTLLIFGDSYIEHFLYDDLAESFHKTIFIGGPLVMVLPDLVLKYKPNVVIFESVERQDYEQSVLEAKERIDMYFSD